MTDQRDVSPDPLDERTEQVALPSWMFGENGVGYRFLVLIRPDGTTSVDGGQSFGADVAKALHLHQSIAVIAPPAGTRALMLTVEEVPEFRGRVNNEAIATLNRNTR